MVTQRNVGFMGIPNPDRQKEIFEVINKYKEKTQNDLHANKHDYIDAYDYVN